jgi:hypothetical protein
LDFASRVLEDSTFESMVLPVRVFTRSWKHGRFYLKAQKGEFKDEKEERMYNGEIDRM